MNNIITYAHCRASALLPLQCVPGLIFRRFVPLRFCVAKNSAWGRGYVPSRILKCGTNQDFVARCVPALIMFPSKRLPMVMVRLRRSHSVPVLSSSLEKPASQSAWWQPCSAIWFCEDRLQVHFLSSRTALPCRSPSSCSISGKHSSTRVLTALA